MTDDAPTHEAPEEESYFVSMTDIMVGLLFIFIIMLMTFALQYRGTTATLKSADELAMEAKRKLLTDVENYLQEHGVKVTVDMQQGVIRLPESVLFEKARADLGEGGRRAVGHVAQALAIALPCYVAARPPNCTGPRTAWLDAVFIEGHTDDDPIRGGRFRDNLELSAVRAVNTYRELTEPAAGLSDAPEQLASGKFLTLLRNRDQQPVLGFSGYGEQRPITRDPAAKDQNRRIDLRFLMAPLSTEELEALAAELRKVSP